MGFLRRWVARVLPKGVQARPEMIVVSPGRVETRFGDQDRVVFQVEVPGSGHPSLLWSVRGPDGARVPTAGFLADPTGEKGVFLAFPVEKTLICRVRATLAGTQRYGEATLVIHPPERAGGRRVEDGDAIGVSGLGFCGAA